MDLAKFVYRLSSDEEISSQFRSDPDTTVEKLGLDLTNSEVSSLLSIVTDTRRKKFPTHEPLSAGRCAVFDQRDPRALGGRCHHAKNRSASQIQHTNRRDRRSAV